MKIKLISIHDIGINFGSTLQACALYDFIKQNGYDDVTVINYKPSYAYHHGKIGQAVKKALFFKDVTTQNKRFKQYYKNHCHLTEEYVDNSLLIKEKDADVFIVGSDQVWNEYYDAGRDAAYYLKFTDCKRKMSYASSVGQIQSDEAIIRLKKNIEDFRFISVREKPSVEQLHKVGLEQAIHVLDPVFLQDKEYYLNPVFENEYGDYLLVYAVNTDPVMDKVVTEIARRLKLKVVLVGGFIQKYKHDFYLRDIGPSEFVNLINNAKFVVANSFHATAFCIMLNKQFALVNPNVSSLRLSDMLDTAGIIDRIILSENDIENALMPIDYGKVNPIIMQLQNMSRQYLLNSLSIFKKEVENES